MSQGLLSFFWSLNFFISVFCGNFREFRRQEELIMRGKILPNYLLKVTTTSKLGCAVDCISEPTCQMISYNRDEQTCRCHSYNLILNFSAEQTIFSNGWRSYSFAESWCPYQRGFVFNRSLDLCYKVIPGRVLCAVAVQLCVAEGARPLIIDSAEEQYFISTVLETRSDVDSAWLGAVLSAGQWFWYDGTSLSNTYSNWDKDHKYPQPQNVPACVAMDSYFSYKWHDYQASGNFMFHTICEVRRPI